MEVSNPNTVELIEAYKNGSSDAREILVKKHSGLVRKMARKYSYNDKYEFEDLAQEGFIGLLEAIDNYKVEKGAQFSTYAIIWIKSKMLRYMQNNCRSIRLPVNAWEKIFKLKTASSSLTSTLGREPSLYELSKHLNVSVDEIQMLNHISADLVSLDEPITSEGDVKYIDTIQDDAPTTEEIVEENERRGIVKITIDERLSYQEQDLVKLRFGFNCTPLSLEEIGKIYKISKEAVRQREYKTLSRLSRCRSIKILGIEREVDDLSDYYIKGYDPTGTIVIQRDMIRNSKLAKYDHPFYKWVRYLKEEKRYLEQSVEPECEDKIRAIDKSIQCVNSALAGLLVNCHSTEKKTDCWYVLKRRIDGYSEEVIRRLVSKDTDYIRAEADAISYVANVINKNNIEHSGFGF